MSTKHMKNCDNCLVPLNIFKPSSAVVVFADRSKAWHFATCTCNN